MGAEGMRVLLIANPGARNGEELLKPVLAKFREGGARPDVHHAESREAVSEDIIAKAPDYDAVAVCGGDGSLNAAARGVYESGLPLGVIPLGTANDLARTLALPLEPEAAVAVMLGGAMREIDLGFVNERPFFNVASIGMSVELAQTLNRTGLKKRFGRLGYALGALQIALSARPFVARFEADGRKYRTRSYQIAIGAGRCYGGGMAVSDEASPDDGVLRYYSIEAKTIWRLAAMARSFRDGAMSEISEVRDGGAGEMLVKTRKPRSVNADGELITKTPARFTIRRKAVKVFVNNEGESQ